MASRAIRTGGVICAHAPQGRPAPLPACVRKLKGREREVATVVYEHGASSAQDVAGRLSTRLSSSAVRSMLMRLVGKGVLMREAGRKGGARCKSIYFPPSATNEGREDALRELADQYFDGSLVEMAMTALWIHQSQPQRGSRRVTPAGAATIRAAQQPRTADVIRMGARS